MTAPVAPPAPDLARAIEEAEAKLVPALDHMVKIHPLNAEHTEYWGSRLAELRTLLAASRAAREERDRMRRALERIRDWPKGIGDGWEAMVVMYTREIAREALAPAAKEENRG